ncbi:hypothetical protein [Pseudomonas aeruginosa]|uniref:hypothetical protein n=1 Tax=Pseudomonas aeruginosa TaxID=287 RepID=UPI003F39D33A
MFRSEPVLQANPAPRLSRTPGTIRQQADTPSPLLADLDPLHLATLRQAGVLV